MSSFDSREASSRLSLGDPPSRHSVAAADLLGWLGFGCIPTALLPFWRVYLNLFITLPIDEFGGPDCWPWLR